MNLGKLRKYWHLLISNMPIATILSKRYFNKVFK